MGQLMPHPGLMAHNVQGQTSREWMASKPGPTSSKRTIRHELFSAHIALVPIIARLVDGEVEIVYQCGEDVDVVLQGHLHAARLNLERCVYMAQ